MRRKIFLAASIVTFLLLGYTVFAWMLLRGVGAYRLSTTLGSVLANSWQYTALVTAVLLVVLGSLGIRRLRRGKADKADGTGKRKPAKALKDEKTELLPAREATALMPETELLAPAGPLKDAGKTELLDSSGAAANGTVPIAVVGGTTVMDTAERIPPAPPAASLKTEVLPVAEPSALDAAERAEVEVKTEAAAKAEAAVETEATAKTDDTDRPEAAAKTNDAAEAGAAIKADDIVKPEATVEPEVIAKPETTAKPDAAPEPSPAERAPKFCANCGAALKPGQRFCTRCGTPVEGGKL